MTQKKKSNKRKRAKRKHHSKNWWFRRELMIGVLLFSLVCTGFYMKDKIAFYYAMYFNHFRNKKLSNTLEETARINRIVGKYADKTFGIDLSHYQRKKDIKWDSLSIGNRSIPIRFVVLRATMGNKSTDKNFNTFWKKTKENDLIRGAYHFYRADEDPVKQANNYLNAVPLESGDLRPILDIERIPRRKSQEEFIKDIKIWLKIVEDKFGEKPIIYTYYTYYRDYLKDDFGTEYPLWLANYNDVPAPSPVDDWDFWQFTENGIVYGINTKVDVNIYNGGIWGLKRLTID